MEWAGDVERMNEMRGINFRSKNLKGKRDHLGDQFVDGRIILKWILKGM
jgi:hypothetical protein